MKIGVIGSGPAGQTLAAGLLKHGNEVAVGTGHPHKLCNWGKHNAKARVMSFAEAAEFGEVVILAVAGSVALEALQQIGAETLGEKIVVDATNPIGGGATEKGVLSFFTTLKDLSDGEAAEGLSQSALRQGVQFRRFGAVDRSGVRRRQADDVHLRQ